MVTVELFVITMWYKLECCILRVRLLLVEYIFLCLLHIFALFSPVGNQIGLRRIHRTRIRQTLESQRILRRKKIFI